MSHDPWTVYQFLMYCAKQNHFALLQPMAIHGQVYRECELGDIGYSMDGTFVVTHPVDEPRPHELSPRPHDLFNWIDVGVTLDAGKPKFGEKVLLTVNGCNMGVNLPPHSIFDTDHNFRSQSPQAAFLVTKFEGVRLEVQNKARAVDYFKRFVQSIPEARGGICMITGVVKAFDRLAAIFTERDQSVDVSFGCMLGGFHLGRDYKNVIGATVHGGPEQPGSNRILGHGIYSTPQKQLGNQTLYMSRIKARRRVDVEEAEDLRGTLADPLDVLLKAMLMVGHQVEIVIASDDDLSALCTATHWSFTPEDWTVKQAIALLVRNQDRFHQEEGVFCLRFMDTSDINGVTATLDWNEIQMDPFSPSDTTPQEAVNPPHRIEACPSSQQSSAYLGAIELSRNASTTTTATTGVAGDSMNSWKMSPNTEGLRMQFENEGTGLQNGAILSAWLFSHNPAVTRVRAYPMKPTYLYFYIDPGRPTVYGAIDKTTTPKRAIKVTMGKYERWKTDETYLTFSLTRDCPRVWSEDNKRSFEEVFPWTDFDLWIKGVAGYIGSCRNAPGLHSPNQNALLRPGALCKHFEKCELHQIDGLNLKGLCAELKKTLFVFSPRLFCYQKH
ncbi:hypothetical protein BT69DRAFT_1293587 [Atractiella rhizophila]|nr:hypothetical protein BT69DRAFT_1293587 [Atractiella rhizophila]